MKKKHNLLRLYVCVLRFLMRHAHCCRVICKYGYRQDPNKIFFARNFTNVTLQSEKNIKQRKRENLSPVKIFRHAQLRAGLRKEKKKSIQFVLQAKHNL